MCCSTRRQNVFPAVFGSVVSSLLVAIELLFEVPLPEWDVASMRSEECVIEMVGTGTATCDCWFSCRLRATSVANYCASEYRVDVHFVYSSSVRLDLAYSAGVSDYGASSESIRIY